MILLIGLAIVFLASTILAPRIQIKYRWIINLIFVIFTILCLFIVALFIKVPEPTHVESVQRIYLYDPTVTIDANGFTRFLTISNLDEIQEQKIKSDYVTIEFHKIAEDENPYIEVINYSYKGSIYYWVLTFMQTTKIKVYSNLPISRF